MSTQQVKYCPPWLAISSALRPWWCDTPRSSARASPCRRPAASSPGRCAPRRRSAPRCRRRPLRLACLPVDAVGKHDEADEQHHNSSSMALKMSLTPPRSRRICLALFPVPPSPLIQLYQAGQNRQNCACLKPALRPVAPGGERRLTIGFQHADHASLEVIMQSGHHEDHQHAKEIALKIESPEPISPWFRPGDGAPAQHVHQQRQEEKAIAPRPRPSARRARRAPGSAARTRG